MKISVNDLSKPICTLDDVCDFMMDIENNFQLMPEHYTTLERIVHNAKDDAISLKNEQMANHIWCIETILKAHFGFIVSFFLMKKGKFYEAWVGLEQVELGLMNLRSHFEDKSDGFHTDFMAKHVERFQSLFPYRVFFSPEILELEKKCSICDQVIKVRTPCGHKLGNLYAGEMCIYKVTKLEFLGTALVSNPVQKYSVPFVVDQKTGRSEDHYDYSPVKYVVERLQSPFHAWTIEKTQKRHPHRYFSDVEKNDHCPCESGKKYKACCLKEEGVLRPHFLIHFAVPPPLEKLKIEYYGYGEK